MTIGREHRALKQRPVFDIILVVVLSIWYTVNWQEYIRQTDEGPCIRYFAQQVLL